MRMSKEDRVCKELRNKVLMEGNPGTQLFGKGGQEQHLGLVINDIQRLLDGCFDFNLNPLSHLRKYFPDFDWKGWRPQTEREVATIASDSDYIWVTNSNSDWSTGIVTATRLSLQDQEDHFRFWIEPLASQGGVLEINDRMGIDWPEVTRMIEKGVRFISFNPRKMSLASVA